MTRSIFAISISSKVGKPFARTKRSLQRRRDQHRGHKLHFIADPMSAISFVAATQGLAANTIFTANPDFINASAHFYAGH
jgi:hypothetical protein